MPGTSFSQCGRSFPSNRVQELVALDCRAAPTFAFKYAPHDHTTRDVPISLLEKTVRASTEAFETEEKRDVADRNSMWEFHE